jgi:hypothetical protein
MTMQLIESKTLGTAAASVEFTSIPQDGTDLVILASLRTSTGTTFDQIQLSFNGSTSSRSSRFLFGSGSAGVGANSLTTGYVGNATPNGLTASTFANTAIYVPNYTGSANKSASSDSVSEANQGEAYQIITAFLWSNTAAITSLSLIAGANNFVVGSQVSLYKVTKGSDGIVTNS